MAISRPVLAGNWKMNLGPDDAREFFVAFTDRVPLDPSRTVVFFPPAVSLAAAREAAAHRPDISFGIQNVHWEAAGAFTGEISAALARRAGARYVLVGHSERRHVFGETLEDTSRKVEAILAEELVPVLCVGETIEQRRGDQAAEVVAEQLAAVLDAFPSDRLDSLVIAYEPVWAIGTGETASPDDAAEMHAAIRGDLQRRFDADAAGAVPILYGGSVKPENAQVLLSTAEIDGVLVGGASLDPAGFARICTAGS
jgi:triosephosphate isomerase (TIM)